MHTTTANKSSITFAEISPVNVNKTFEFAYIQVSSVPSQV